MGRSYNVQTYGVKSGIAYERKAIVEEARQIELAKAKNEALWYDYDKLLAKKAIRKKEAERKRLETLRRKQENKKAYEEDMKKAAARKKGDRTPIEPEQKVTIAMLLARREAERKAKEEEERKAEEAKHLPVVPVIPEPDEEDEIEENLNKYFKVIGVPDDDENSDDENDDKDVKSVYLKPKESLKTAFETIRIAELKAEYPKYRLYKLKEMASMEWEKSGGNPLKA